MLHLVTHHYGSPCGTLLLAAVDDRLCLCDWTTASHQHRLLARLLHHCQAVEHEGLSPIIEQATAWLDEYFSGLCPSWRLPFNPSGTPFQRRVWAGLLDIPYGCTLSYGALARSLGMPRAVRAVAGAVGANPLSLFVPCHRVTGSHGALGGYAGGEAAKRWLLDHEHAALTSAAP